ncbi:TlpA family protein disulfide reductase [Cohnella zeiphila]|uniref:TlpA family protein disulfide reductase n=1 Tax=Cohnella zeiphila TaxID=2761120 RepID=A0A7X0VVS8_9BACL|nr:TlpA disulfide reductase family protein [Cohnella zeiphila]MBB6730208.1 TlpA family protein disulfide reductase [Cohnella zeiphila]
MKKSFKIALAMALWGVAALPTGAIAQGSAAASREETREAPEIGAAAPSFTLTGMDGKTYNLRQFRGKPVLLNFWASWCGPCREEAPYLTKLKEKYGNELQIVAVNVTDSDSEKSARQFASSYGFTFPVLLDPDGTAAARYRIRPIPTSLFIDANGVIRDGVLGAMDWNGLLSHTERLLRPAK